MKVIGSFLIIIAFTLMGFRKILEMKENLKAIEENIVLLNSLKTNLEFSLKSPEELFKETGGEGKFFLKELTVEFLKKGCSFKEAFREALKKETSLLKEEKDLLRDLSSFLGLCDRETELKRLEIMINNLTQIKKSRESVYSQKNKLSLQIYISLGIALVIVLI